MITEGTWDYEIPSADTIPKEFNVEILHSGPHKNKILSSKGKTMLGEIHWFLCTLSYDIFNQLI